MSNFDIYFMTAKRETLGTVEGRNYNFMIVSSILYIKVSS